MGSWQLVSLSAVETKRLLNPTRSRADENDVTQVSQARTGKDAKSSSRSHKLSKTSSGPSRIDNKRQKKIISMVDGYDSTVTISAGLRNLLLVWVLPGLAMIIVGFMGMLRTARSTFAVETFDAALVSLRFGSGLLSLVTIVVSIVWAARTWSNIRRVGKRAKVGAWGVIKRHGWFMLLAIMTGIMSLFYPPLLLVSVGAMFFAFSVVPFLVLALVRLFWRTGSPPIGQEEDLPHYGILWFVSWFIYSTLSGSGEYSGLSIDQVSVILIITGISCVTAAVTGAKLVTGISQRHDERLATIIGGLDLDQDEATEVTSRQIESAWADSENLVSFDR